MKSILNFLFLFFLITSCDSQSNKNTVHIVGGPCEGCEAVFEYGNKELKFIDTLPLYIETEPKLHITGTVFQKDGITPAKDVILYIYQTNREGIYVTRKGDKGWGKRHGFIRGWVKTNKDGKYGFYTFRPGAYPNGNEPEHIHLTIKEPNKNEYYADEFVFDDDPLLIDSLKRELNNRCGSGITTPKKEGAIIKVKRDIILGLNIPDYN